MRDRTPIDAGREEERQQQPWRDAIGDPEVWSRLSFHARFIGTAPPAALLVAMLDRWDLLQARVKGLAMLDAMSIDPSADGVHHQLQFEALQRARGRPGQGQTV